MSIIILGDLHFDIYSGTKADKFIKYQNKFIQNILIPYIIEHNIKVIVQVGDMWDKRTSVSQKSIHNAKKLFFDPLQELGVELHILVGNHENHYKESLAINTSSLILKEYSNITIYSKPTQISLEDKQYSMIPWICLDNEQEIEEFIKNDTSKIAFGHLELAGAKLSKHSIMEHGMDYKLFKRYKQVISGHYHTKSEFHNIKYIGTPYELTKVDCNDQKSFIVLDGKKEIEVKNPYTIFQKFELTSKEDYDRLIDDINVSDLFSLNDQYVEIFIDFDLDEKDQMKLSELIQSRYQTYDLKIISKQQQNDELLVVDVKTIKNNLELILRFAELNQLSDSVTKKLLSLYNSANCS